jgi:hypothetical protein
MRSLGTSRSLLTGLAALLAAALPAAAQDSQYWNIQYGPVGQLLGGQVVGSSRDLSATYYNPGGLGLADDPDFLLSVQGFKAENLSTEALDGSAFPVQSVTSYGSFPGFFGAAFPESWLGETRLAFSLLTRQEFNVHIDERAAAPLGAPDAYGIEAMVDQRMSEVWGGLTVSRKVGRNIGIGATLYGVNRTQRTRQEQSLQSVSGLAGASVLAVNDFNYYQWRMLAKLGVAWEGDAVRLGLAVTTPSAALFGSGSALVTNSVTGLDINGDGLPDSALSNGTAPSLDAHYQSSWSVAGGAAWRRGSLQLHASGEWFAATGFFDVMNGPATEGTGLQLTVVQDLKAVFNGGVGAEYWFGGVQAGLRAHGTAVYGAFSTDFTASPDIIANEASTSSLNLYHLTGGTSFDVGSSRFSLGVAYSFGSRERTFGLVGVPPGVPVLGEGKPIRNGYGRWTFMLGYLFGN